jgi:RNA polymerase II elongation factor ELL
MAKVGSKSRRRSPKYTSSEDEAHQRKAVKHNAASRPRPSIPLATDHAALHAQYNLSYDEYIPSFHRILTQKRRIEALLKNGTGSVGSITDSDGDVELMDTEDLAKLHDEHNAIREELEHIQQVWEGKEMAN